MKKVLLIIGLGLTAHLATHATDTNSIASSKIKPDLLTTCPVSGDKLGEMAPPTVIVYKGQEVKLCCSDCKKDFDKNPEKYIAKIRAADKKAKDTVEKPGKIGD